ncbi:MAG TPA: SMC-Scp complex subunit ScpB [Gammaproteobacteria bacterium]|nr:SMC-Scp complex subunit ScpB [Gammaproteobacteria bacterium]
MDETEIKHVLEAALLAAGRPLSLERLTELFTSKGGAPDRATLKRALDALASDYAGRGIELKEIASGYRVQVKRNMGEWLQPLWEERAPRYTRALLETLALVAYRQPITRAEIEEVRGVVVSTNIVRTLLERSWIRVVGHRDVPGKPAMFGTTKEFLDYFGLKKLEDLPTLAEIKDGMPELSPQTDLLESLEAEARGFGTAPLAADGDGEAAVPASSVETMLTDGPDDAEDETELNGPDLFRADGGEKSAASEHGSANDDGPSESAEIIPLRAADDP